MSAPSPAPDRALELPLHAPAFAARVRPFVEAGLLDLASVHVVDLLALGTPLPADVLLGLSFAVQAPRGGHVGVELARLRDQLFVDGSDDEGTPAALLPSDAVAWQRAVERCALVGSRESRAPFVVEHGLLLTHRYADYQARLAAVIARLAASDPPGISGAPLDEPLLQAELGRLFPDADEQDLQRLGALSVALQRFTVLSGGPGTGKTYTVRKVLALLHAQWTKVHGRPPRVALAAPTGKAAVRLRQSIRAELEGLDVAPATREWLRELAPLTIHRLLGFQPASPTRYRHGVDAPLPHELVVVDESSMVDLALMCKLVEAVGPDARLVLLGDRNQLASVEAGSALADLTRDARALHVSPARAARVRALLGKGSIAPSLVAKGTPKLADAIVQFVKPHRVAKGSGLQALAWEVTKLRTPEAPADRVANESAMAHVVGWLEGGARDGRGPYADLSLLPHEEGRLSREAMARIVAGYAGPGGYLSRLLVGSRTSGDERALHAAVLSALEQLRVLTPHRAGRLGVAGLNRAIEEAIDLELTRTLRDDWLAAGGLRGPHWLGRPVLVTENDHELGVMNGDVGVFVDRPGQGRCVAFPGPESGSVLYLSPAQLPPHETVFAMTVHKSQGSEFQQTFLVLPAKASRLLTRELLYTAMTRAKRALIVCGDVAVLRAGLEREVRRASGLGLALWGT